MKWIPPSILPVESPDPTIPMFVLRNNATGEHFIGQFAWTGGYTFEFDLDAHMGDAAAHRRAERPHHGGLRLEGALTSELLLFEELQPTTRISNMEAP